MSNRRWRAFLLGLMLLIVWSMLVPATASAEVVSVSDYQKILRQELSYLKQDPRLAPEVAQRLRQIWYVEMPDQSTIEVDVRSIVYYLTASPPRVDDAIASITSILTDFDRAKTAPMSANGVASADASLAAILSRSEFQPRETSSHTGVWGWIGVHLRAIFGPILGPLARILRQSLGGLAPWRTIGVIALIVIGILVVITIVVAPVRGFRRLFGPRIARYADAPVPDVLTATQLRQEADELARNRSYRLAVRTLYLAALVRLDERGLLRFERALTNREVLRSATSHDGSALSQRLAPLVDRVDRYWYGTDLCTEQEYREFAQLSAWAWEGV
ncbi:MAG: DUF4129 domain-containing protein [Nitrolancea sp.]